MVPPVVPNTHQVEQSKNIVKSHKIRSKTLSNQIKHSHDNAAAQFQQVWSWLTQREIGIVPCRNNLCCAPTASQPASLRPNNALRYFTMVGGPAILELVVKELEVFCLDDDLEQRPLVSQTPALERT